MMDLKIIVVINSTAGAAFEDGESREVARILHAVARKINGHPHFSDGHDQALHDFNGKEVGYLTVVDPAKVWGPV